MKIMGIQTLAWTAMLVPGLIWAQQRSGSGVEDLQKDFKIDRSRQFRLEVSVDAGEVRVTKGQSEDRVKIGLHYSQGQFRHSFRFSESRNELEVSVDKESWWEHESERTTCEVEIELPTAGNLDLDFRIKAGKTDMELGGLRIAEFYLKSMAGEVDLDFAEPNPIEMARLDLNTKIGASNFRRLGNARFRLADINSGIGELTIDFEGAMLANAEARVDLDIGETVIRLPRDVGIRLAVSKFMFLSEVAMPYDFRKEGRYYFSDNYDQAERTLQLQVSSGLGELRLE